MLSKYLYSFGIMLVLTALSACGGTSVQYNDRVLGYVSSENFPDRRVEIYEFRPQFLFNGRGYSYASTLYDSNGGFDIITLPLANTDIRTAALSFCSTQGGKPSRFFDFTRADSGVTYHRMFFNCE